MEKEPPSPELPKGFSLDDLRFVHPQLYPIDMGFKGWSCELHFDIDGNPAKVSYTLARPLSENFDLDHMTNIAEDIGIMNEGEFLKGYSLKIDTFNEARPISQKMREVINPHEGAKAVLIFNFTGFPTEKTMQVLMRLEKRFLPPKRTRQRGLISHIFRRSKNPKE